MVISVPQLSTIIGKLTFSALTGADSPAEGDVDSPAEGDVDDASEVVGPAGLPQADRARAGSSAASARLRRRISFLDLRGFSAKPDRRPPPAGCRRSTSGSSGSGSSASKRLPRPKSSGILLRDVSHTAARQLRPFTGFPRLAQLTLPIVVIVFDPRSR